MRLPAREHGERTGRLSGRRGYILIIVLGFTAIATALGLAFLDANSTVMPEAVNYKGSIRAQYQAGSGVAMASHYLMYPPTTVAYGSYWTGANNVSIDGSTDYFNVSAARADSWTPAQSDPNLYRITATGVATDPSGSVRAKKQVTAEVMTPLTQKWQWPYTYFSTGALSVPTVASIYGDAFSNSSLTGTGFCNGKLGAVSSCAWLGTGPPVSLTSLAPTVSPVPSANPALYSSYTILGRTYTAYTAFTSSQMTSADAVALNAIDMSATNPGRIIMASSGDFKVKGGVNLSGTLVVSGRLQFEDNTPKTITAVQDFPAAVMTSDLRAGAATDQVINLIGPVICGGVYDANNKDRTVLNVTGPLIVSGSPINVRANNQINLTYSAQRAVFWDFQGAIAPKPITVLSWKEN